MENPRIKKGLFYTVLFYILSGLLIFFPALIAFSSEGGTASRIKKATRKLDGVRQV